MTTGIACFTDTGGYFERQLMTTENTSENDSIMDDMIPDYEIASYVGGGGAEQFKTVGKLMVKWFVQFCDLQPNETVLEVGCGIGRVAIPLTQHLKEGRYEGFDIVPAGIEWCQQKVTPRYPNFRFILADVYNKYYHPAGSKTAAEYHFPYDDGSFDFVYLTSVFTHMLPLDMAHYIAEISRVLKPGGRCFCTAYIINGEALEHLKAGSSKIPFQFIADGGYWTNNPDNPEHAIAYPEEQLKADFAGQNMETTRIISMGWWAADYAQDILIAQKKG